MIITAKHQTLRICILSIALISCPLIVYAGSADTALTSCLQELLLSAPDNMTVGQIKATCREKTSGIAEPKDTQPRENAIAQRIKSDQENILKPFTIMAHKQNYFLFGAHNFTGYSVDEYAQAYNNEDLTIKDTETQFQLSIKTPLAVDLFGTDMDIFAAYTVRSFWQLYANDISSPFRETNHEPEFWLQTTPDFELFGFHNVANLFGIVHQSNGQSGNLSRSWNRVYANILFHRGNFVLSVKPWIRIQEDREDDDNPDISDYLGHAELVMAYKYNDHTFTMMSRNNIESGFSKGAIELGWSFPLFDYPYIKGYVQYFSGYGESLIDYDQYVNRLGVGILLTDLL